MKKSMRYTSVQRLYNYFLSRFTYIPLKIDRSYVTFVRQFRFIPSTPPLPPSHRFRGGLTVRWCTPMVTVGWFTTLIDQTFAGEKTKITHPQCRGTI